MSDRIASQARQRRARISRYIAHSIGRFLLLDLLVDKRSRPIFIYAALIVLFGALISSK